MTTRGRRPVVRRHCAAGSVIVNVLPLGSRGAYVDRAAVLLDDPSHDVEAESAAGARPAAEALEQRCTLRLGHAVAVVFDGQRVPAPASRDARAAT